MNWLLATLLFSGSVDIGPGKTRTLEIPPSPQALRLSCIYSALRGKTPVRAVLIANGHVAGKTETGAAGDMSVALQPGQAYRLVLDNPPGAGSAAKVRLRVEATREFRPAAGRRTGLALGSILAFLGFAAFGAVILWRNSRPEPQPYS